MAHRGKLLQRAQSIARDYADDVCFAQAEKVEDRATLRRIGGD